LGRYAARSISRNLPFQQRSYIIQEGLDFDHRLLDLQLYKNIFLEGYWQSQNYFIDIEKIIRQDLIIKPPSDEKNKAYASMIGKSESVAVHLRFFDMPGNNMGHNLVREYYLRAINIIEREIEDPVYFVFSDQPGLVGSLLPISNDKLVIVHHNHGDEAAYADLWLMTQCKNFIIANSTFSWWGAWLCEYPTKKVIAPGFKLFGQITSWGFEGLLPNEWVKI
jgi:hypothetical protein